MNRHPPRSPLFPSPPLSRSTMMATHSTAGKVDRTRPLCLYPQVARWKGTGSSDEAANFACVAPPAATPPTKTRSEEHTSELQSHSDLVCRLLLEKKKK